MPNPRPKKQALVVSLEQKMACAVCCSNRGVRDPWPFAPALGVPLGRTELKCGQIEYDAQAVSNGLGDGTYRWCPNVAIEAQDHFYL